jgi:hypothetical protein
VKSAPPGLPIANFVIVGGSFSFSGFTTLYSLIFKNKG